MALESTGNKEELSAFGRLLSMHVAATNPVAMDLAGVPLETLSREKAILEEKNAGKPANVLEKVIRLRRRYARQYSKMPRSIWN